MKYIVIGLLLMTLTGCGADDNEKKEVIRVQEQDKKMEVIAETSPKDMEKAKTPPAIPKI